MESFARLLSEHTVIICRVAELRQAVRRGSDGSDDARHAIAALSTLLREHFAGEDRVVYRRLLKCRDSGIVEGAQAARRNFATLARDWHRYADQWTDAAIKADPAAFAAITEALLDRLDARVAFEDQTLYPLAVGLADLPLRDTAAPRSARAHDLTSG